MIVTVRTPLVYPTAIAEYSPRHKTLGYATESAPQPKTTRYASPNPVTQRYYPRSTAAPLCPLNPEKVTQPNPNQPNSIHLIEQTRLSPLILLIRIMQMLRNLHNSLDMLITQSLPALACEQLRGLEDILDLPAVHAHVAESTQVLFGDFVRESAFVVECFRFGFFFVCW